MNPDEVNKSLRLTANAIQNYSFDKVDKLSDISIPICDLADEKDSGISQVSADGLEIGGLEEKLAMLDIHSVLEGGGRVANGRGTRGPQAMDDMLYGNSDNISHGKLCHKFNEVVVLLKLSSRLETYCVMKTAFCQHSVVCLAWLG